ncbi:MAG: hypothetical protein ABI647_23575 [Gemmatimonadota bacterium]
MPVQSAGLGGYLKKAFLYRWNMLAFIGAGIAAVLSPWPDALLPLVGAMEMVYLGGLISRPRFRDAVDAELDAEVRARMVGPAPELGPGAVSELLTKLPTDSVKRFGMLHARCLEMRSIAAQVRGRAVAGGETGDELRGPSLDRLLWVFLRLLVSQDALRRFLRSATETDLTERTTDLQAELAKAGPGGDTRLIASLTDSVAVAQLRLDNYKKADKNAEFIRVELDRIESKIQALTEMAVNRQDPDVLSSQVDAAADSMQQTESAINELQQITGLADHLTDPPPIMESDLSSVLRQRA